MSKHVRFQNIEIFEFQYILGDNPSVSSGCPIALGHDLKGTKILDLNSYETSRRGKRKRRKNHLILPVEKRAKILLLEGYSLESIANATLEAHKINKGRILSASNQNWDKISEVSERFGRVLKRALGKKQQLVANTA